MRRRAEAVREVGRNGARHRRAEAVVETLATLDNPGESLAGVAHDARNMVAALGLYCDLLEEPGVLGAPFAHYSSELRIVAAASLRLVEKLSTLDARAGTERVGGPLWSVLKLTGERAAPPTRAPAGRNPLCAVNLPEPVGNLEQELVASRNLLSVLAGPAIALRLDVKGGLCPVRLTATDLTRVLVNLVKNAAEAMPTGGRIEIGLREHKAAAGGNSLVLTVEDNGPGIPEELLGKIFESGFSTSARPSGNAWPVSHRGLGLAISRSIVETAGGSITASNRAEGGARFEIELPAGAA